MASLIFEDLLAQADANARQGDWEATLATLQEASQLDPRHSGALTGIGTCLIQLQRPAEALAYFQKVVILAPESAEAYNNLGVASTLNGQPEMARDAYQQAVELDPDHLPAWKNLALFHLQAGEFLPGAQILAAVIQAHPQDAETLYLLAQCYEGAQDFTSARLLYRQALDCQPGWEVVQQALDRLPPTPVEAPRIARPEHARKLAGLKSLKSGPPVMRPGAPEALEAITFYGPANLAAELRLGPSARALAGSGWKVRVSVQPDPADLEHCDRFVFSRPQTAPVMMDALRRCVRAGKQVLVDLDEDFLHPPIGHPFGADLGQPESQAALAESLQIASVVTVPGAELANLYRPLARRVEVIPYGWDSSNPLWEKPAPRRGSINIGLVGGHVYAQDTQLLKTDLARLLHEQPRMLLTIALDLKLYEAFNSISDDRRLFLPAGRLEDYPYLLANLDLLLVPLQPTPYNRARPDLPLLEAGLRRIPWIATPIPAFTEWGAGGLFAEKSGDWYRTVTALVEDASLRAELGEAGWEATAGRTVERSLDAWLALLSG